VKVTIPRARRIEGEYVPPADKSISHRAAILLALSRGTGVATNFLRSRDTLATVSCLRALGASIELEDSTLVVSGTDGRFTEPFDVLNAENSGTTMRLLSGILAGQPFYSVMTGDEYLRRRPMKRIIEPLSLMGAHILSRAGGFAPLSIRGGNLHGIDYNLRVASAQVKSCILLAGLFADGPTTVREEIPCRDHTERLLSYFGADITRRNDAITLTPGATLEARSFAVPGDVSSAAFFLVAAAMLPGSHLVARAVGLNPTRTGLLAVLERAGVQVDVEVEESDGGEPVGTVEVRAPGWLRSFTIDGHEVPAVVDEIPVLAVLATQAEGETVIRGAAELRVKETDRLSAIAKNLRALGATLEELPDGLVIRGPVRLRGAPVEAGGDHRIAMALAVAALVADGETTIDGADCVAVSYPAFFEDLERLVVRV
jgi:3-phosphoshikimate 1-carboxyvinyltransferase